MYLKKKLFFLILTLNHLIPYVILWHKFIYIPQSHSTRNNGVRLFNKYETGTFTVMMFSVMSTARYVEKSGMKS